MRVIIVIITPKVEKSLKIESVIGIKCILYALIGYLTIINFNEYICGNFMML